jgi:hypothetical protein
MSEAFSTFLNQLLWVYIVFPVKLLSPCEQGCGSPFCILSRCTLRVQYGYSYGDSLQRMQQVVWRFWAMVDLIDGYFPL